MQEYVTRLRLLVEENEPRLLALPDSATAARPGPGRWAPREVLGHLIDSASNNHQRFVRAQWQDSLVFAGYDQEAWVVLQKYESAPWEELVALWRGFNLHLAWVMEVTPEETRLRPRAEHNLHQIAWRTIAAGEPATLDYLMADYVGHLEHHLRQILGDAVAEGPVES
jgi:hypothetical protein